VSDLVLRHDARRPLLLLLVLVVVPCAALVLLAHQHVRSVRAAAARQYRETCEGELAALGLEARARLLQKLEDSAAAARARPREAPAEESGTDSCIETVFFLDPAIPVLYRPYAAPPADDRPQLSAGHPARSRLLDARRAPAGEAERAISLYREVLASSPLPGDVRASVLAEMAAREMAGGRTENALGLYEEWWTAASEASASRLPAALRALETAAAAGLPARTSVWVARVMEEFGRPDRFPRRGEPACLAAFLQPWAPADAARLDGLARWFGELDRLHPGPFQFTAWTGLPFQRAIPTGAAQAPDSLLLVDLERPLRDGRRIGWALSATGFVARVAGPVFRRFTAVHGGSLDWSAAGAPDRPSVLSQTLPAPLDLVAVRYDLDSSSLFLRLAASRTRYLTWTFGISVAWLLAGLGAVLYRVGRSMNLAKLQADMLDRVGHELRTPVAAISVLTESLENSSLDEPTRRQVAGLLRTESGRIQQLVERLLAYARGRRAARRLAFSEGRLDDIVRQAARLFSVESGAGDALPVDVAAGNYAGRFDIQAVSQAILNLLDNAVKYSEPPPRIEMALRRDGPQAVLTVTDHGIGMPPDVLRSIFKPYYRADTTLSASVGGIGVGLAIVQAAVRAHGGRVGVRSTPGHGSVFEIRLPLGGGAEP